MNPPPLISQLRFTRNEWRRALAGVSAEDAVRRLQPMNSISWIVGHLAWQEQGYWLWYAQGKALVPELDTLVGFGRPASTPPLDQMWEAWQSITSAADLYLDTLTTEQLQSHLPERRESIGTMLLRVTYHYWFHIGEVLSIRQMLGHTDLPEFVGELGTDSPYRPE